MVRNPSPTTYLLGALLIGGCDTSSSEPTSPEPTATLTLSAGIESVHQVCYAVRITGIDGTTAFERGIPDAKPATVEAALADGAVCSIQGEAVLDARCAPGPSQASVWPVGFFGDGQRLEDTYNDPCGGTGCTRTFACPEADTTQVDFDFTFMRVSSQGFFDLSVSNVEAPEGVSGVCYALRVTNGEGAEVFSMRSLCSDDYGNGPGADVSYVVPCDAASSTHSVTVWVHAPEGSAYETSCPAPLAGDVESWTGGCTQTHTCIRNEDVTVLFDLEAHAR